MHKARHLIRVFIASHYRAVLCPSLKCIFYFCVLLPSLQLVIGICGGGRIAYMDLELHWVHRCVSLYLLLETLLLNALVLRNLLITVVHIHINVFICTTLVDQKVTEHLLITFLPNPTCRTEFRVKDWSVNIFAPPPPMGINSCPF